MKKTVLYNIDDFKREIVQGSAVLFDLTAETRNNSICTAIIKFSLFGTSHAGEVVEYQDDKRISILKLPGGVTFDAAVNSALSEYRSFAIQTFNARPGRYDGEVHVPAADPSPMVSEIISRMDRIESDMADLSRRMTRLAAGGGYDE